MQGIVCLRLVVGGWAGADAGACVGFSFSCFGWAGADAGACVGFSSIFFFAPKRNGSILLCGCGIYCTLQSDRVAVKKNFCKTLQAYPFTVCD